MEPEAFQTLLRFLKAVADESRLKLLGLLADNEYSVGQLSDMLNGILLMAQAGLNGPRIRTQLDPRSREAYLEILKTADVSRIDRRETKSIRLVFDVSPSFLAAAAHSALPLAAPVSPQPPKPAPKK